MSNKRERCQTMVPTLSQPPYGVLILFVFTNGEKDDEKAKIVNEGKTVIDMEIYILFLYI